MNLVEIDLVVLVIQKAEFGNFAVPVNNTLVCCTSFFVFLAADTLLCVLILLGRQLVDVPRVHNTLSYVQ